MLKRLSSGFKISTKIFITSLAVIAFFLAGFLLVFLPSIEELVISERRHFLKERSETVLNLFRQYDAEVKAGVLTLEDAQGRATRRIKGIILSKNEYFWIMDTGRPLPKILMHPVNPNFEGNVLGASLYNTATAMRYGHATAPIQLHHINPLQAMVTICLENGSGYVTYAWPKPASNDGYTEAFYPKESYVALFEPWGWILGTGEYNDDLIEIISRLRMASFAYLGLATLVAIALAIAMASSITRPLRKVIAASRSIAEGDLEVSSGITGASDELGQLSHSFDNMALKLRQREEERVLADRARQESERKMRAVFENAFQMIWLLTPEGELMECNQSALDAIGAQKTDVLGKHFSETPWWSDSRPKLSQLHAALKAARGGDFVRFETTFMHPHTGDRHIDFSVKSVQDDSGRIKLLIPEGRDITEIRTMEGQLQHMGLHDPLTGLANRTLLRDRIQHALQVAKQKPDTVHAALYLDINRFKIINDSLGHVAGDTILQEVARRILARVRGMDTVARYSGDDFVILLWDLPSWREVIRIARLIQHDLGIPLGPPDNLISIEVSIGAELFLGHHTNPDDVVRNAHLAMSYAKAAARSYFKVYTPRLLNQVRTSLIIENEMARAIREGEFFLLFQPIVDLRRGRRLVGMEALCRWRHPKRGLILPSDFIPVAEETKLIVPLGAWVLDTACASMVEWRKASPDRENVFISVNLSARQLERSDIVQTTRDALERYGLPPELLHLEITESSLMESNSAMMEQIIRLKMLGVHLSVDDFGTGYSNLSLLIRLHFSDIKIDRSLIWQVESLRENRAVIKAITTMAGSLGATVIVEGVETDTQSNALKSLGCNIQQGYYYSRPVALDDISVG
ncbi:MAG: EAL domain-containing protein [Desulfovibrio sp.]|nr:EAL domain-containing protein [Desulfovibrio sp.]